MVPVLSLLERSVPAGDGPEPWESVEAGVDVVMCHLEAARAIAHHGALYRTNAEARLQGEGPATLKGPVNPKTRWTRGSYDHEQSSANNKRENRCYKPIFLPVSPKHYLIVLLGFKHCQNCMLV